MQEFPKLDHRKTLFPKNAEVVFPNISGKWLF